MSVFLLFIGVSTNIALSQTDSLSFKNKKVIKPLFEFKELEISKPRRAALLSAALPGAGQLYNKTYWEIKVPIIYTGAFIFGYMIRSNHENYREFREAFLYRQDDNPATNPDDRFVNYTDEGLLRNRDRYRRDRDFAVILSSLWYILNIAEAITTSHLNEFDVSDDLSMKIQPTIIPTGNTQAVAGLTLKLQLK